MTISRPSPRVNTDSARGSFFTSRETKCADDLRAGAFRLFGRRY
jgi:hypothetical protein